MKKNAPEMYCPKGFKTKIRRKYNNRCASCQKTKDLTMHHVFPRRSGGVAVLENLVLLCVTCHDIAEDLNLTLDQIKSGAYCGGGQWVKSESGEGSGFTPNFYINPSDQWVRPLELAEMMFYGLMSRQKFNIILNSRSDDYRIEILKHLVRLKGGGP